MYVKGNIQYRTNETAKTQVDKIKKTKIPGTEKTFGAGLEGLCKSCAWYYEEEAMVTGWLHSMVQRQQWI